MNSPDITYLDLSFAVIRLVQSITIAYILLATFFDSFFGRFIGEFF